MDVYKVLMKVPYLKDLIRYAYYRVPEIFQIPIAFAIVYEKVLDAFIILQHIL